MLPWEGVERRESLGGGGLAGSPGTTVPTEPRLFFLLDRGTSEAGRSAGTGSFSRARYTRCIAWQPKTWQNKAENTFLSLGKQSVDCYKDGGQIRIKSGWRMTSVVQLHHTDNTVVPRDEDETHHSKFIFIQMSVFIDITQIPHLSNIITTPDLCYSWRRL